MEREAWSKARGYGTSSLYQLIVLMGRSAIGRKAMQVQIARQAAQNKPELVFFERALGMTLNGKGRK